MSETDGVLELRRNSKLQLAYLETTDILPCVDAELPISLGDLQPRNNTEFFALSFQELGSDPPCA
jgi:hypothetical protein